MFNNIRSLSSTVFRNTSSLAKAYFSRGGKQKQTPKQRAIPLLGQDFRCRISKYNCMSVPINHILGASWNVTVFKTYSDIVGKESDRQNVKSVSAEEVQ